jgi:SAM-dependent methyltransferase
MVFPRTTLDRGSPSTRWIVLGHGEFGWYAFGLLAGVMNLRSNGATLGWKKTIGKIVQPINTYTRFPEYQLFHQSIRPEILGREAASVSVLDIGSPKLFGFYLAWRYHVDVRLTDINPKDIEEYTRMWSALRHSAAGQAVVEAQDGRALTYPDHTFDVVYSMSAIEHVEGGDGDGTALREAWRTLKPGGIMVVSVPYGKNYLVQSIIGFSYTATQVAHHETYFFQRIYDRQAIENRLLTPLVPAPASIDVLSAYRVGLFGLTSALHTARRLLGTQASALFGPFNPWISLAVNRHRQGYPSEFISRYGLLHSLGDIYPDAILICRKPPTDD